MDKRPILNKRISRKDFREFYWLKKELVGFCRGEGLKTTGAKIELAERIENYLRTGRKDLKEQSNPVQRVSNFDWKNAKLSLSTKITDNYTNTENVRSFFQNEIGKKFKFNVKFMAWMKSNVGNTLRNAVDEWIRIYELKKDSSTVKQIAPQFEYNRYLRDFLLDNPDLDRAVGIKLWNIKKSQRGDNKYRREDLNFIEDQNKS